MSNHKENKGIKLPPPKNVETEKRRLPFNGTVVQDLGFTFSFACFDRKHKLFNLGGTAKDKTVGGAWFIKLLDCLKDVSGKTMQELKRNPYQLHPVEWDTANAKRPESDSQCKYWQFRLDKSSGRVIGIIIDRVFYVVWLDPHHNLTDSDGYGGIKHYAPPP